MSQQRQRPVPGELAELIELVNALPAETDLVDYGKLGMDLAGEGRYSEFDTELGRVLTGLPPLVQEFLGLTSGTFDRASLEKYCYVQYGQKVLRAVARRNAGEVGLWPPYVPLQLGINKEGKLGIVEGFFGGQILGTLQGVEARRIKECPTCQKIFWAGRFDQPCCSKRCGGALRTRRWRQRYPERYKLRRNS